jgi:parallel beta-helix repeat protein
METKKPRRLTSSVLSLMLVLSVLAVMNFTSMNVRASGPQYIDWNGDKYITANDTFPYVGYDSAVINLTDGDLIICDGIILTFNDDVSLRLINSAGLPGDYGIQVNSTATFNIVSSGGNCEIKSGSAYPARTYSFLNSGTIDFLGATVERVYGDSGNPDTTGGIRNMPGSTCNLTNCNILDGDTHGIYVEGNSTDSVGLEIRNTVIGNSTSNVLNGNGIRIEGDAEVLIDEVIINEPEDDGIKITDASNVTIQGNTTISYAGGNGIYFDNSIVKVQNCDINNISGIGIDVWDSTPIIEWNKISNTLDGISLYMSNDSRISNNTIIDNSIYDNTDSCISLQYSNNNVIRDNYISGHQFGISLSESNNNIIEYNMVEYNNDGIEQGSRYPGGYITNNTISNNIVTNSACTGIWFSSGITNSSITNNIVSSCLYGIYFSGANNITIFNNTISSNQYGLSSSDSTNSTITHNTVLNNSVYGFYFINPSNNTFYHNNFIDNNISAYDDGSNSWDNGYPFGGNYWDDYSGYDNNSGPGQNVTGPDGIGDTPYINISGSAGAQDEYPLMTQGADGALTSWLLYNGRNFKTFTSELTVGRQASNLAEDIEIKLELLGESITLDNIEITMFDSFSSSFTTAFYMDGVGWLVDFPLAEGQGYIVTIRNNDLTTSPKMYALPNFAITSPIDVPLYNGNNYVGFPVITSGATMASELALDILAYINTTYSENLTKEDITITMYDSAFGTFNTAFYIDGVGWLVDFALDAQASYIVTILSNALTTSPRIYVP